MRQIRLGNSQDTRGTAYVVYEEVQDAVVAHEKLSGYNFQNRYLVILYHSIERMKMALEDLETRKANLEKLKKEHNIE